MRPSCFSQIIGNDNIKKNLSLMVSRRSIGHALLFTGPEGVGKSLFAWALAAEILFEYDPSSNHFQKIQKGQHPDIHVYQPEGKLALHSIQTLRQFSEEIYLPPFEANWKIFIIHEADRMLSYSANALLKTFEEPPPRTLIILLSNSQGSLLPTILSRCSILHFQALSFLDVKQYLKQHYPLDESSLNRIACQAQGSIGRAVKLAEQSDDIRLSILKLLRKKPLWNYRIFREEIQTISEQMEVAKKPGEENAKETEKNYREQLTAQERIFFEKEWEGKLALSLAQEAQMAFEVILSWYRDLQVLLLGGPASLLTNFDFQEDLEQAVQRGEFKPLDQVYKAVQEAYLSLQRSTPFSLSLETLLLKLDRV